MCGESRMHGVKRGKIRRLSQRITYRYMPVAVMVLKRIIIPVEAKVKFSQRILKLRLKLSGKIQEAAKSA